MATINRMHASDLRGATRVAFNAAAGLVDVIERMHRTIQARPGLTETLPPGVASSGIAGAVYRGLRGGVRLAGRGIDASLGATAGLLPDGVAGPRREAFVAALNGVYGDHLARTGNPLAIQMSFRQQGSSIEVSDPAGSIAAAGGQPPTGKLLVLVHGLCMNDLQWHRKGHDHGAALADALGFTPLYLRYNSGLHIWENGRAFAALLETLVSRWPCPLHEIAIIGHSMGGLVTRSACHEGAEQGHAWLRSLRTMVFLGTPHHGSPLERGGHGLDRLLQVSPYSAPLTQFGKARSAGIQDLRHGTVSADDAASVPLPPGVKCFAVAATLAAQGNPLAQHLVGDGFVPLHSALGRHADPARTLAIPQAHQWVGHEMGHLELLCRPEVYTCLEGWLQSSLRTPMHRRTLTA